MSYHLDQVKSVEPSINTAESLPWKGMDGMQLLDFKERV